MRELRTEEEIINTWQGDSAKPIVSISCITYNHENYIRDAIEGFLMQRTTFPFQKFILDDASTDRNADIIREYECKYPKLFNCFYLQENTWGKPTRREKAKPFLEARNEGKYIALCEGDDYWTDPLKLQKQVDFLEANKDYGLAYTSFDIYDDFARKITSSTLNENNEFKSGYIFEDLLKNGCIGTLTVVVRKHCIMEALKNLGANIYNWKMGDYPLWLEISTRYKIGYLNISSAVYRKHGNSAASHFNYIKMLEFRFSAFSVRKYFIEKYSCSAETKKAIYPKYNKLVLEYNYLKPKNKLFKKTEIKSAFRKFRTEKTGIGLRYYLYYLGAMYSIIRPIINLLIKKLYPESIPMDYSRMEKTNKDTNKGKIIG